MARFMLETPKVTSRGMTLNLKVNLAIRECKINVTCKGYQTDNTRLYSNHLSSPFDMEYIQGAYFMIDCHWVKHFCSKRIIPEPFTHSGQYWIRLPHWTKKAYQFPPIYCIVWEATDMPFGGLNLAKVKDEYFLPFCCRIFMLLLSMLAMAHAESHP